MRRDIIVSALLLSIFAFVIYGFLHDAKEKDIERLTSKSMQMILTSYNSIINTYKISAQKDMNSLLENSDAMQLLREFKYASESDKSIIRGRLYRLLYKKYYQMKKLNIRQFHFHTHEGKSLLRFHKPARNGDFLIDIRESIKVANQQHKIVSGFEGGRIYPGFRYVFPIIYNGEHLGSVEFSIAFESIERELGSVLPSLGYQLNLSKNVSYDRVFLWHRDYFIKSILSHNYYIENPEISLVTKKLQNITIIQRLEEYIQKNLSSISEKIETQQNFSIPTVIADAGYMIHFIDIKNTKNMHAAYMISYSKFDELTEINDKYTIFFILLYTAIFMIFLLIVIVSNQLHNLSLQKENLQHLLNQQENIVILSSGTTITYANQKFFDFFNLNSLDEFLLKNNCVCEKFIKDDRFFHLDKIKDDENWLDAIRELPQSKSIVAMMGKNLELHSFSVSVNIYEHNIYILSFADISDTMVEQIKLQEKTLHDKLTHAYNREYFEQNIDQIIIDYTKTGTLLALTMLDIDFFKKVNDTFGHDIGDVVLQELVKVIGDYSRDDDILIRWGGEEFLIIFKVHSKNGLFIALENLRQSIEKHAFDTVEHITCSLGSSIYREGEMIKSTIKRADKALYTAKNSGRNKVVIL